MLRFDSVLGCCPFWGTEKSIRTPEALGALFSAWAFAAMFFAVKLQAQQLSAQREELALQRAELEATRVELAKTAEANMHVATLAKKNLRAQYLQSWIASRSQTKMAYEITRIRWGGPRYSINFFSTGTTYSVFFGNDSRLESIELKRAEIFSNFVDRLWKAVGVPLLIEYLKGLRAGKTYRFGAAILSDTGMELEHNISFRGNERIFCRWDELSIWNGPGVFCMGKRDNHKLVATFFYQDEDNIHILEAGIRMFLKRGGVRISSLLEG